MGSQSAKNTIRVLQWNARSLADVGGRTKIGEHFEYLGTFDKTPEIIAIQETWNHQGQKLIKLPRYKTPVSYRRKKGEEAGRGGVATFVKQGLDSEEIKFQHSKKKRNRSGHHQVFRH